jgi:arylsulfatase A-like enzyme
MESHRPYGRGEDSIGKSLDRKALFAAERLTESERDTIKQAYRGALERVDSTIGRLLDDLDATDPVVAVTSDHGDEFGEKGYYFHQPQRCRVAQPLVEVPVAFAGADVPRERLSLLDVAPTLLDILDLPVPDPWHGYSLFDRPREQTITLAPWHNSATMLWQDFSTRLIASDADVSLKTGTERIDVEESEVPADIQDRLRDLGYVE